MIKIYLVGISCVGKSSIGKLLAEELGFSFYDFDTEIEKYFGKPIEYIQEKHIFQYDFREETRIVLKKLFGKKENSVIASLPSGLRDVYLAECRKFGKKRESTFISIYISDKPENILERLTFYDKESRLLAVKLSEEEKRHYLKEIKKDGTFFKKFNNRADFEFNVEGLRLDSIPKLIIDFLETENEEFKRYRMQNISQKSGNI